MDRGRTYMYAIIAGEVEIDLDPVGIPNGSAPVTGLQAGGLTAVIGQHAGSPSDGLTRGEALRGLITHQSVIERIMADRSVLPVRFMTILDSADDVRRALITFRRRLESALRDVSGAVEVDVSATWEMDAMFAEIKHDAEIAALAGVADKQAPEPSLATRIQVGKLVQEALERQSEEYRHRVIETLRPLVRDMRPNPLPTDDVVLNIAFLVDRARLEAFDGAIDRLGSDAGGRVNFRYVGPLPPYSFATVILDKPEAARIASAAQMLGLEQHTTAAQARAQYRRLAAEYHPDRHVRDRTASERFAALTAAYRLVMRYMEGQYTGEESGDENRVFDLTPEIAERTLLLEIAEDDSNAGFRPKVQYESGIATT